MQNHIKESVELACSSLTSTGEGVCDFSGLKVFVEGVLPGEKIVCQIISQKKNYAKGTIVKLLEASKERVVPICPYYEKCGGCQLMHVSYEGQLKLKKERVIEAFSRIGGMKDVVIESIEPSDPPLFYRNKIQLPTVSVQGERRIGLYAKGTHDVVDIEACLLHNQLGERVYKDVRRLLKLSKVKLYDEREGKGELRTLMIRTSRLERCCLILFISKGKVSPELRALMERASQIKGVKSVVHGQNDRKDNVIIPAQFSVIHGPGFLSEEVLEIKCKVSAASFFQVNLVQAEKLYLKALELGEIKKGMKVIDAYSGVGILSCLLAKKGALVTAIEVVDKAVEDALLNAKENQVEIRAIAGKVEEVIPFLERSEVVYLNPPRKGCEEIVLDKVAAGEPQKIIYTSCDPATLARDARILKEKGYGNIRLYLFDLFSQTMHIENVACFIKN